MNARKYFFRWARHLGKRDHMNRPLVFYFKRSPSGRTRIYEHTPPPPPPHSLINALVTLLILSHLQQVKLFLPIVQRNQTNQTHHQPNSKNTARLNYFKFRRNIISSHSHITNVLFLIPFLNIINLLCLQ